VGDGGSEYDALTRYCDEWVTHEPRWSRIGPSLTFATIAAPSRSAANVNVTKSRDMPPSLFRIQRSAQGSRSAIREKRSDEVVADEDRRITAAAARHVLGVDGINSGNVVALT
jgi:hypothetical protein